MASTTFINGTVIVPAWLNDVNDYTYDDVLDVKNSVYGAVGDGVTSDQTAVAAVVAAAYSAGKKVFWPAGTYLTTASIPNFHSVKHYGPGKIKRGSDVFAVEPVTGDTNVIYLSTTGSSSNDGLSASEAINTLTNAWTAISNYGPLLVGKWKIQHAAGTYSGYHRVPYGLSSEKLVEILGPDVSGHPNVPTAIYDNNGATNKVVSCVNKGMKIKIKDIKAQECENSAFTMNGGLLVCENVHTTDCYIGIDCASGQLYVSGGLHTVSAGYLTGYARIRSIFNNYHAIGYSYEETTGNPTQDASIAACPQLSCSNGTARGVHVQERATGHVYVMADGFSTGVNLASCARANFDTADLRNNSIGIDVGYGCDAGGTPVLNTGTANANTIGLRVTNSGVFYVDADPAEGAVVEQRVGIDLAGGTVTGTTTLQQAGANVYTMSGQTFDYAGCTLRMVVGGTITGTAGTKTIFLRIGSLNGGGLVFQAAAEGPFTAEVCLRQVASGSQYSTAWGIAGVSGIASGVADATHGATALTLSDGTSRSVFCGVQLSNAADSVDVDFIELYRIG